MPSEHAGEHDPAGRSVDGWPRDPEPRRPAREPPRTQPPLADRADVPFPYPHGLSYDPDGPGATEAEAMTRSMLRGSLAALIRLIEKVSPGVRGSVLLLDGATLHHGAAPHLPTVYCRAIDGASIGPAAGSCGTAAYRRERVIVRDIASDPLWDGYRAAALPFGLAACWSTPIVAQNRVLGTFAMYYDEPREPTAADLVLTETAALLAANIIGWPRALNELRASEDELRVKDGELRAALEASSTSTWRWDMVSNAVHADDGLYRLFGVDATENGSFELFI